MKRRASLGQSIKALDLGALVARLVLEDDVCAESVIAGRPCCDVQRA
jgi:hypothetical protein